MSVEHIKVGEGHVERTPSIQRAFLRAADTAKLIRDGYVKKIIWDKEGGYPRHSWGFMQFSPRPYRQGYGCDGTTDRNIQLIAIVLCAKVGINYEEVYRGAYPDTKCVPGWVVSLLSDQALLAETLIPAEAGRPELMLMLSDLYQINNRAVVMALEEELSARGFDVDDWPNHENELRAWRNVEVRRAPRKSSSLSM